MALLSLNIQLPLKQFILEVNRDIPLAGITAIFGYSGAGKTSLLRAISGLAKQTTGQITFKHSTWLNSSNRQCIKVHQRRVGFVFQDNRLFEHLSVAENLQYAVKRKKNNRIHYSDVVTLANIGHLLSQMPATLSGGEHQRVAIARAVLNEPEILLLDEPFSALDIRNKASLINLLQNLSQHYKLPMLYVSHSLDDIQQLADRMMVLDQGKVSMFGKTDEIIHKLNYHDLIHQQTSLSLPIDNEETLKIERYGLLALSLPSAEDNSKLYLSKPNFRLYDRHHLRCYIRADDISICLTQPVESSIVNQLCGYVDDIKIINTKALIKVICYQQTFFVMISLFSLEKLALNTPLELNNHKAKVYIQFKASSVKTLQDND